MAYSKGTYSIDVVMAQGCEIEFKIPEADKSWVHMNPESGGSGRYILTVDDGNHGDTTVEVYVNQDNHCSVRDIEITSPPVVVCDCNYLQITPIYTQPIEYTANTNLQIATYSITKQECSENIKVTNVEVTSVTPNGENWISIKSYDGGKIYASVTENTHTDIQRSATITISSTLDGGNCQNKFFTIEQKKKTCQVEDLCTCYKAETATQVESVAWDATTAEVKFKYSAITWTMQSNCVPSSSYTTGETIQTATNIPVLGPTDCSEEQRTKTGQLTWFGKKACTNNGCSETDLVVNWTVLKDLPPACLCNCTDSSITSYTHSWGAKESGIGEKELIFEYPNCCTPTVNINGDDKDIFAYDKETAGKVYVYPISNNDGDKERNATVNLSILCGESTCTKSVDVSQLMEGCDCKNVQHFIKTFKRTFSNDGSNGKEVLVGSGQTDCGGMLARTESDIFGWPENDLRSEQLGNGEFAFYGVVAKNTKGGTRDTGVIFVLIDKDGHEIVDGCQSTFQIRQGGPVCKCGMTTIYFSGGRDGEPVRLGDKVAYSYNQQGDTTFELGGNFGGGGCGAVYIDYDEEYFEGKSYNYHSKHWFREEDVSFDFKLKKTITEDLIQTITVTEYADAVFDGNNELIVGYKCVTYDETVLIAVNCSCELELGSSKESSSIHVTSSGGKYTLNLNDKLYCAEDATPRIEYDSGGEGWATIREIGGGKWELTIAPNNLTYSRILYVKIIPKVNGETCDGENYGYYVHQDKPTVTCTCDEKKETIEIKEYQHYGTYCSESEIRNIDPTEKKNPNCPGFIKYKVLSCIPDSAFYHLYTYTGPGGEMYLRAANNTTSEDWVYTVRAYIGDEECGKDFELTIDKCSNVCDCRHRRTVFQFDINPELKACYPKPATEEIITIGTVGEIKDECLAYKVVSSQENACEPLPITIDNKVQVKLKYFAAPQISISLVVVLYDKNTNNECQTTGLGDIKFDIKENCTED